MQIDCTEPLYEMLINDTWNWIPCSHALNSGGIVVVGTFMYAAIFTVLLNWTESLYPPMVWTVLSIGVIVPLVPGGMLSHIVSAVTIMTAGAIVALWQAWRR